MEEIYDIIHSFGDRDAVMIDSLQFENGKCIRIMFN